MRDIVLVADLDNTLLATDMLYESFWASFAKDWRTPLTAVKALPLGKPALKRAMLERADIDVTTLPYIDDVLNLLREWRAAGGRTALVTASDAQVAQRIADHLQLFDEVFGTTADLNLKGTHKAEFLIQRYGDKGFDYIGDTDVDLHIWKHANRALSVGSDSRLRRAVSRLDVPAVHMAPRAEGNLRPHLKAMRPHQWLKNLLVFIPMLTAHDIAVLTFMQSLMAFLSFSLVASSVYVLNDLLDLGADRAHPRKRRRPFASGALRIQDGTWMAPVLLLVGACLAWLVSWTFLGTMVLYYIVTMAYSLMLKRQLIVDICTLAVLYTMRIAAGAAATGLPLSVWLLAFSIFFFFSLAAVKRQAELVDGKASGKSKAHGRGYMIEDLPIVTNMAISSGFVSVLVMALYVNSPQVTVFYNQPAALWGICLVLLYWLSRMVMITHRGKMHDDPVVFAAKDRVSQICALLMLALGVAGTVL
ncbi:prenyltransferase [Thioclava sp. SK-1]|nr:prenyltransferase [Thioclava sp. SK-1]